MEWNQQPLTKRQILKLGDGEPMVQTITVPLDVQLTTAFGSLTPIRPENVSDSIFGPNSEPASRVNVTSATIAALKAGLALHFRRQVTELAREHRRAVAEIPRLPKTVVDGRLKHLAPSEKKEEKEEEEEKRVYVATDTYGTSSRSRAARALLSCARALSICTSACPLPSHITFPPLSLPRSLSPSLPISLSKSPSPSRVAVAQATSLLTASASARSGTGVSLRSGSLRVASSACSAAGRSSFTAGRSSARSKSRARSCAAAQKKRRQRRSRRT